MGDEYFEKQAGAWSAYVEKGDPWRDKLAVPVILENLGDLNGKRVLEAGCGNGYCVRRILQRFPNAEIVGVDKAESRIAEATAITPNANFLVGDFTSNVKLARFDQVYSVYMLMETNMPVAVKAIGQLINPHGRFVAVVVHPAWVMHDVLESKLTGKPPYIIKNVRGYFDRREGEFWIPGTDLFPPHFQFTVGDYFKAFRDAGFDVTDLIEQEITEDVVRDAPLFERYLGMPGNLVLVGVKK